MQFQRADESRAMALYAQDDQLNIPVPESATWETMPPEVRVLAEARFIARYKRPLQPPHPMDIGMTPEMIAFGEMNPPKEISDDAVLKKSEYLYNTPAGE